jgi:hypothetical protein
VTNGSEKPLCPSTSVSEDSMAEWDLAKAEAVAKRLELTAIRRTSESIYVAAQICFYIRASGVPGKDSPTVPTSTSDP